MDFKFKVFCTFKIDWDLSGLTNEIDFTINQKDSLSREELLSNIIDCHGIITNPRCRIDKEVLDAAGDRLKVISTTSGGFNHIDMEECSRRGIPVGYLPNTFADAVAEFTIGLILTVTRKISTGVKLANNMDWNKMNDVKMLSGKPIRGSIIGIFGLGRIGLAVSKLLTAFNVKKIIYSNRSINSEATKLGYEYVSFEDLLKHSDILICCASLNKQSEGIFNIETFKMMKKTSLFINVARGAIVNQNDLLEALKDNIIGSAGLDVTTPEPLPNDHPFYSLPNCVITPHIAGDDQQTREELKNIGLLNLINGLKGIPLKHQVPSVMSNKNSFVSEKKHVSFEKDQIKMFIQNCMIAAGSTQGHAADLADCLIEADCRGHFSHGLSRLDKYVRDVIEGRTEKNGEPKIIKESAASALVDGCNLLGPVIGNFCMSLAIKKAKEVGIGMVTAYRATHFGIAGFYTMQALKENLIGISMCNTSPIVFPTRSNSSTFGTNPISLAAPAADSDSFVLDMATTTVALGKLEVRQLKNEMNPVPPTWLADENGLISANILDVLEKNGALFPLGGPEELGGYKGYGLTFLVEILTGILAGANFGPHIRKWGHSSVKEANLGFCFIAINPEFFAENFQQRLKSLIDHCRGLKPIDPSKPVLIPGDIEREHSKECNRKNNICYHINQLNLVENLAKDMKLKVPNYSLL